MFVERRKTSEIGFYRRNFGKTHQLLNNAKECFFSLETEMGKWDRNVTKIKDETGAEQWSNEDRNLYLKFIKIIYSYI
jgi:hypothetical protein